MKISNKRRLLSLLLALAMALTLAPTALLADKDEAEDGEEVSGVLTDMRLSSDSFDYIQSTPPDYDITLEPNASVDRGGARITATLEPVTDPEVQNLHVTWSPTNSTIVGVSEQDNGHVGNIWGIAPGTQDITVSAGSGDDKKTCTIHAVVSGIQLSSALASGIQLAENSTQTITVDEDYFLFGNAESDNAVLTASVVNNKNNVYLLTSGKTVTIEGRAAGSATVRLTVSSAGRTYEAEFPVTVTSNDQIIEWTEGCSPSKPLKFSALEERIASKYREVFPGGTFASLVGLSVPTAQGTIYLGYTSPEDTGAGAGSSLTYYYRTAARGPYIQDLAFVPNSTYVGEKAYITFTAQGTVQENGKEVIRTFKGRIEVTLTQEKTDLTVFTKRDTPLKLSSALFSTACQEETGSPLRYVVFTLPPANQGALYVDYKDEWNYASMVSASQQYKQSALGNITFVPAQGFVGTVTVSYAGYSVSGNRYNGQLVIQVQQGLDDVITYTGDGAVTFSRYDFDSFCQNATGRALSSVSFTPPPASQGTLYYNWNGARGTAVAAGTSYSLTQIDRLTFVAADTFHGIVRIPFTGADRAGETFSGTVEVHIQSAGTSRGDISYTCAAGQSVKLALSDFTALCQSLTGQKLHYISFQTLPDFNLGTLYHGRTSANGMGTRVTTTTKYFNSATPYIANLSFWATDNFRGGVEIPFTGCAINGQTFTAVLYISNGEGAGSGTAGAVRYSILNGETVTFSGQDFDDACRQATNSALNYLRFGLPSSGQGILYYDYRAGTAPTALSTSTNLYRSGETSVDKVTFVPASGFAGIATVPFTAVSIDGKEYNGVVEITVGSAAAMGGLVRYETGGAPVRISAADILSAAGEQPTSLRLTGLPTASQGKLYYQYTSPTKYSWMGNTTTEYSFYGDPSVSNLTFVPKAGYTGTVEIPYTAATAKGNLDGTIRITVSAPYSSRNFDDMGDYSAETKAAVDYLSSIGVVNGTGPRTYTPGASIRRGDFCLMLSRAFQFNVGATTTGFSDVPANSYYAQAINEMYALGIVNGVGGGRFQPNASLSRQDAALMIQRTLEKAGISTPDGAASALSSYSDRSQVSDYAQGAVAGLVQLGLLPTSGSRLSPKADLTRADMAVLLHRAMTQ